MAISWANSGFDLHLVLPAEGRGRRAALESALREAVVSGRLAPGTPLPPSRVLAAEWGLARNTVADTYAQLVAEGWLAARQGAATWVARRVSDPSVHRPPAGAVPGARHQQIRFDLRPGRPDLASFPRRAWGTAARKALTTAPNEAFDYPDPRGPATVRATVAGYLARARGVRTGPDRMFLCSGYSDAVRLLSVALAAAGARSIAVESYGIDEHRAIAAAAGLSPVPIEVDADGARTDTLDLLAVDAAILTPAHQFPLGMPLSPDRRSQAIAWARERRTVVLEDDYDGEFRYDRQPIGALQALDPEAVAYAGTVSKSLAPGLRLGWLVVPAPLVEPVALARRTTGGGPGVIDQLTLAELIRSGGYDRHVRSARLHYRRRRDRLESLLAQRVPSVRVTGIAAGLHAMVELPPGSTEREVLAAAARRGLAVFGLDTYRHPAVTADRQAIVVGYATPAEHAVAGAFDALCESLIEVVGAPSG